MRGRRVRLITTVPLIIGAVVMGSATAASAAPSGKSSCIAQFVNDPTIGSPGQSQRFFHFSRLGQDVRFVAQLPKGTCYDIFQVP